MSSIHSEILKVAARVTVQCYTDSCPAQLQTSSVSLSEQALLPAINTLRVLGKFLGLLVFLPHQLPAPLSLAQVRNMVSPISSVWSVILAKVLLHYRYLQLANRIAYCSTGAMRCRPYFSLKCRSQ